MEKIAIIDIGSNMARLVIANILEGGYFVVIDELEGAGKAGAGHGNRRIPQAFENTANDKDA